jgi:hypothetical protein
MHFKFKKFSKNAACIIVCIASIFCVAFYIIAQRIKINKLDFQNKVLEDAGAGFVKYMHEKAEDLFYPYSEWDFGNLSGISVDRSLTKSLKISEIKLKSKSDEEKEEWLNSSIIKSQISDGYLTGFAELQGYTDAVQNNLTSKMISRLEKQRNIVEYNGCFYIDCSYDGELYPSYCISNNFFPEEIKEDKLAYRVHSEYVSPSEKEKYDKGQKIDKSKITTSDKKFVLVKQNNKWLIDEFETSFYYNSSGS